MTEDVEKQPQIHGYFDISDLQNIQNLFSEYTGIPCVFFDKNGLILTKLSSGLEFKSYLFSIGFAEKINSTEKNTATEYFTHCSALNKINISLDFGQTIYAVAEFGYRFDKQTSLKKYNSTENEISRARELLNTLLVSLKPKLEKKETIDSEIYQALFENNHSVMLLIDPENGDIFKANSAALAYYGWTKEEICSKKIYEINRLSQQEILDEMQLAKTEKRKQFFFRHLLADNSIRDVEVYSGPIYYQNKLLLYSLVHDITDRKKYQNELIESEQRWKYALEGSTDGVWDWNLKTNTVFYSTQWKSMLGYSEDEISNSLDEWSTRVHPEDLEQTLFDVNAHLQGKTEFYSNIHRVICKDGSYKWILDEGKVIEKDALGNPSRVIGTHKDISQQKSTELALQESEVKYSKLVENISDVLFEIDNKGVVKYISSSIKKILGFEPNEIIGKNFLDLADYNYEPMKSRFELLKSAKAFDNEYQMVTKDGEFRWIRISVNALFEEGNFLGGSGIMVDITEKRIIEDELRKLSRAVEQSPVSIVITNLEGNIEYANPKACETTGYTLSELMDQNPRVLKSNENVGIDYSNLWKTISEGNEWHGEFHNKKKNGAYYWEYSTISPIFNTEGKISHYIAVKEDITFRKLQEEKIKLQNERLNAIISAIPDLIFVIDQKGFISEYYCSITDSLLIKEEAIIGSSIFKMFEHSLAEEHYSSIQECIDKQMLITYEYAVKIKRKNRYFELRMVPFGEKKVLTFVREITEKKLFDLELKKLSLAVLQSPVSIVITDLKSHIEFVNPAFEKTTGYTKEELIGVPMKILKSGHTQKETYKQMWDTITSGKIWRGEWLNKRKNGELFWENISINPIYDESGKITNYLAVKQDITERKTSEKQILELNANLEAKIAERTQQLAITNENLVKEIEERKNIEIDLLKSKESYSSVVENIKEVIFQTDAEGKWIFLNQAWVEVTGFSIGESIGQNFLNYVHPDDRQRNMDLFMPLICREKDYCRHQVRYLTKDGGFRWIEVYARLGIDNLGNTIGTYGTLLDVTEHHRAKEFEREILMISSTLTGITVSEIDASINEALKKVGKFLNADRSYIFEFHEGDKIMSNTFEWCNDGITAEIENLQNIPIDIFPYWMEKFEKGENVIITNVDELSGDRIIEKEYLQPQGIQALLAIPLYSNDKLNGFVGLDAVVQKRDYTIEEINILKIWGSILSSLLTRWKTESLLENTRQNYETFFNTIDDFLWVIDQEGNIIHINNTVRNRLNYKDEDLYKKSILMVHPPARRDEANQIVGEMLNGTSEFCPVPVLTKEGTEIPVETRVKHGYWNGKPVVFGVSKDISKIKLSEQKFSTAFHSNSAMMAISLFETGEYVDVNNAIVESLGYSKEELIGKTNKELNLFIDTNARALIINNLKNNIPVRKMEVQLQTKSGKIKYGIISADSIYIGNQKCLLTVTMDITERKFTEVELEKARQEAERANLAKSEFLSRMSHELRTPMNSILGFAQLMNMGQLDIQQKKGIGHILKSGTHLLNLINEVLDISRIESGKMVFTSENIKLNNFVEEAIDTVQIIALQKHIEIIFASRSSEDIYVSADKQRLKQILLNLLNNAIKYNKTNGKIKIEIIGHEQNQSVDSAFYRLVIQDTGYGISKENLTKLFTPFERIGADKFNTEGTGLGLSVVKKLIEAMGGNVGVISQPNEGSTFWIDIPKCNTKKSPDQKDLKKLESGDKLKKKGRILYFEDNKSNLELVEQILENQRPDLELISLNSGKDATQNTLEIKPDLILLDLNLPEKYGADILHEFKTMNELKNIPVIIISADALPDQKEKLMQLGAIEYVTKPINIEDFLNLIDRFF